MKNFKNLLVIAPNVELASYFSDSNLFYRIINFGAGKDAQFFVKIRDGYIFTEQLSCEKALFNVENYYNDFDVTNALEYLTENLEVLYE